VKIPLKNKYNDSIFAPALQDIELQIVRYPK